MCQWVTASASMFQIHFLLLPVLDDEYIDTSMVDILACKEPNGNILFVKEFQNCDGIPKMC